MNKFKKGFFDEEVIGCISPGARKKIVQQLGKHIEYVDANGAPDECKCPYCEGVRKDEFEELYG